MENNLPKSRDLLKLSLALSVILLTLFLIISGIYYLRQNTGLKKSPVSVNNAKNTGAITGKVEINGVIPDKAIVSIAQRKPGESQFVIVESNIPASDGVAFRFEDATVGTAYEIIAYLKAGGDAVSQSEPITIVAPANDEVLKINSTFKALDDKAEISGTIDLNGYLRPGSTITVSMRKKGETDFVPLISGLTAIDGAGWSYSDAVTGVTYELEGYLIENGIAVSQSKVLTITAPAHNESIRINSKQSAPAPVSTTISGHIDYNGPIPPNSSISIQEREEGTTQFKTVITGIGVADKASWNWSQAVSGTAYDLQALLLSNNNVIGQTPILTVSAPAADEVLTFNSQNQPIAPKAGNMSYICLKKNNPGNGLWQVQINYNTNAEVSQVVQYRLTIGNASGQNQLVDMVTSPQNPNQIQRYNTDFLFNEGQSYYAQWSYSNCSSCSTFSAFSPALQFSCITPSNTPIPTQTPVPQPTNTPVPVQPTNTPAPTEEPPPPTNFPQ